MNPAILKRSLNAKQSDLDVLKKALTDNGFVHTSVAANVMLSEMKDDGLPEEAVLYYQGVALNL